MTTQSKNEKGDPDTRRITSKAGLTDGAEFDGNLGLGFHANQTHGVYPEIILGLGVAVFKTRGLLYFMN